MVPGSAISSINRTTESLRNSQRQPTTPAASVTPTPTTAQQWDTKLNDWIDTGNTWAADMRTRAGNLYSNETKLGAASSGLLGQYQNMLGGLQGPVSEAMRQRSLDTIRSQYGTQLRGAQDLMAQQGVRGPAAIAAGADIRNQMGKAIGDYERDLVIADYQAKLAALNNLNQYVGQERAGILGTEAGLQQYLGSQIYGAYGNSILGGKA